MERERKRINILCLKITFNCEPFVFKWLSDVQTYEWIFVCLPNNKPTKGLLVYFNPDMTYVNNELSDISSLKLGQTYVLHRLAC